MNKKILQVFYGADALPYKDKERTVHFPIVGNAIQNANNTTQIKFYFDRLIEENEQTTFVAVSKLPNGKIGSKILETYDEEELGEQYALLDLDSFYTQYKGDVFISLQGYQGGVRVEQDEQGIYQIYGTPVIAATGSIKLAINYAPSFVGSGETENVTLQQVLGELSTKLGVRQETLHVEELPTVGNPDIWYVVNDDENDPNKANIYIWNATTQTYIWVGDNTLDLSNYYTIEQGQEFEQDVNEQIENMTETIEGLGQLQPSGVDTSTNILAFTENKGIYVGSDTGYWYYWNGSQYVAGGVYAANTTVLQDLGTNDSQGISQKGITNRFFDVSFIGNYLNPSDEIDNKFWYNGNLETGNNTTKAYPKCNVAGGKTYKLYYVGDTETTWAWGSVDVFYADGSYSRSVSISASTSPFVGVDVTLNSDEEYVGITIFNSGSGKVVLADTVNAEYYEHKLYPKIPKNYIKSAMLSNEIDEAVLAAKDISFKGNELNAEDEIENKYWDNGSLQTGNNTTFAYPKLKLDDGGKYYIWLNNQTEISWLFNINIFYADGSYSRNLSFTGTTLPFKTIEIQLNSGESYVGITGFNAASGKIILSKQFHYENEKYIAKVPQNNVVFVGNGCKYETIQDAIDNVNDSEINPITLFILNGTYERFDMTSRLRYISLIGQSRENVIVTGNTGNYDKPTANIRTVGRIANITFKQIATNETKEPSSVPYCYACHDDSLGTNVDYENCTFISNAGPAVGLGTEPGHTKRFVNCEFINTSNGTFGARSIGAFFAHNNDISSNDAQVLKVENCTAYGTDPEADDGFYISQSSTPAQMNIDYSFRNCGSFGHGIAHAHCDFTLNTSYGNNVSNLNN